MKKTIIFFIVAALLFTCGSSVYAAEAAQQEPVFTVTPRVWFAFVDSPDQGWYNAESTFMPLYGLTASLAPRNIPNWSFLITGLHGTSDGDITETEDGNLYRGSADYNRSDIELLVRYTFPGTGLSLFFGPRYIKAKNEQKVPAWDNYRAKEESDIWAGEVGVGFVSSIGESGHHRFFSNLTLGIAYSKWDWSSNNPTEMPESGSGTEPMIDVNIGYEYLFTSSSSLSLRYRIFATRDENDFGQDRWGLFHGPEIGLSFRF